MSFGFLDFETRSPVSLKTGGTDRYMTEAEPIVATFAADGDAIECWDMLANPSPPQSWISFLFSDPKRVFIAHNASFDKAVMDRLLLNILPAERWICTRAQSYAHALPGSLEGIGAAVGLGDKDAKLSTDSQRLIRLFCIPNAEGKYCEPKDQPAEWQKFLEYAVRDTHALRETYQRLPRANFTGANLRYYWLNARVNERGFAVDLPLVTAARSLLALAKDASDAEVTQATGGAVSAVSQRDKLLAYLRKKHPEIANLRKATLQDMLEEDDLDPETRLLVRLRLDGAKASTAKFKRADEMHVGERIRYTMQFSGAGTTGRTAHKGFQPGNMPWSKTIKAKVVDNDIVPLVRAGAPLASFRPYGGAPAAISLVLQHCIVASPGHRLVVADFKNVESRVLAWLADESWKLEAYRAVDEGRGADLYRLLYSRFFGGSVESVSENERQAGKVIELACGFGGSVGAFATMSVGYNIDLETLPPLVLPAAADPAALKKAQRAWWRAFLSDETYGLAPDVYVACHVLVQKYRAANPKIDQLKKDLGKAVERAIRGDVVEVGRCKLWADTGVFIIQLPSGRRLFYWHPKFNTEKEVDPETGEESVRVYVTYKRCRGKGWVTQRAWPGLWLENIVQAVANDLLRYGSLEVDQVWRDSIVLDKHDEIVCEVPEDSSMTLAGMIAAMCRGWDWCRGLPLAASGWEGPRYGKR